MIKTPTHNPRTSRRSSRSSGTTVEPSSSLDFLTLLSNKSPINDRGGDMNDVANIGSHHGNGKNNNIENDDNTDNNNKNSNNNDNNNNDNNNKTTTTTTTTTTLT